MAKSENQFSVVVVGSGFASSFFLKRYLDKADSSARVLVLERGQRLSHGERLQKKREETVVVDPFTAEKKLFSNPNPRKDWAFSVGFGGSSNCWWACTPRFLPADFTMKSTYGVGQDWPISYAELEPYYEDVEDVFDVSGPDKVPFPKRVPYPQPPHLLTTVDQKLAHRYPGQYIAQPTARSRIARKGRSACCANGVCSLCPVNAKFTIENGLAKVYQDPRVELRCLAEVTALDLKGSRVSGVHFIAGGKPGRVSGDLVVLGANALFNPTLLMRSGDTSKQLGRGLSEQIAQIVTIHLDINNVGGSSVINAIGYMLYDGEHRRDRAACLIESQNDSYIRFEAGKHRHVARFKFIYEDLPQEDNRVAPLPEGRIGLEYDNFSEYTQRSIDRLPEDLEQIFGFLPVEDIAIKPQLERTESHILGTHRMSLSENDGVVDGNQVHHKYRNLFVLGGGSFPTISPSNPTLTISALAMRSAESLFL